MASGKRTQYDVAAYVWPSYTGDEPRSRIFWPDGEGEWQITLDVFRDLGIEMAEIERIYVAGGFGTSLDVEKAMLIGLLPMIGGAMFSAPMVEEASQGLNVSRERKTFVNYWFRHSLETIFPLYPSLVLAAGLIIIMFGIGLSLTRQDFLNVFGQVIAANALGVCSITTFAKRLES